MVPLHFSSPFPALFQHQIAFLSAAASTFWAKFPQRLPHKRLLGMLWMHPLLGLRKIPIGQGVHSPGPNEFPAPGAHYSHYSCLHAVKCRPSLVPMSFTDWYLHVQVSDQLYFAPGEDSGKTFFYQKSLMLLLLAFVLPPVNWVFAHKIDSII